MFRGQNALDADIEVAADLRPNHHPGVVERVVMADKSHQKSNLKKQGKTLKEKRASKKAKQADKSSSIPPTGH
ncbi:hypothetical protein V6U81_02090 [Micromonospora sp. CPCC 205711]|uniref:hypothetical protein n=1 Tax=Micromonospora sp. CPCC 205547 TaxID=3122400 RepID=UPI002FF28D92